MTEPENAHTLTRSGEKNFGNNNNVQLALQRRQLWRNMSRRQYIAVSTRAPSTNQLGLVKDWRRAYSTHLTGPCYLRQLTAALSWFLASARKGV